MRRHILRGLAGAVLLVAVLGLPADGAPAQTNQPADVPCGDVPALIAAINKANAGIKPTVTLAPQCTYTLTTPQAPVGSSGPNGLPTITGNVTIASFRTTIVRSGLAPPFRMLEIAPTGQLSMIGTTLDSGVLGPGAALADDGAGILNNHGKLNIFRGSAVLNSTATGSGGGIFNEFGQVSLTHTRVMGNKAGTNGGGITNHGGQVVVTEKSVIDGNVSQGNGGGIFADGGTTHVIDSEVAFNTPQNCYPPGAVPGCVQ